MDTHFILKSVTVLFLVLLCFVVGVWVVRLDTVRSQVYEQYEQCVLERAGMSVAEYRARFGYVPECN